MNNLKNFWQLITKKERKYFLIIIQLYILQAIFEMIGVASILPFMAVLTNPNLIETNLILNKMIELIVAFGAGLISFFSSLLTK